MTEPTTAIDAPLEAVLALFATDLAAVKFPDLDRAVLEGAAARVRKDAETLARAEEAVAAARAVLRESQDALLARAQRALAYARVYAEENPELSARVEAIALPRGARSRPRDGEGEPVERRRGRPRRSEATLFDEGAAAVDAGA